MVDACEVRERGEAMLALDPIHNHERLVPGAAARAVGDGAKIRARGEQGGQVFFKERAVALVGLGWEKFQRDDGLAGRLFGGVKIADEFHGAEL